MKTKGEVINPYSYLFDRTLYFQADIIRDTERLYETFGNSMKVCLPIYRNHCSTVKGILSKLNDALLLPPLGWSYGPAREIIVLIPLSVWRKGSNLLMFPI